MKLRNFKGVNTTNLKHDGSLRFQIRALFEIVQLFPLPYSVPLCCAWWSFRLLTRMYVWWSHPVSCACSLLTNRFTPKRMLLFNNSSKSPSFTLIGSIWFHPFADLIVLAKKLEGCTWSGLCYEPSAWWDWEKRGMVYVNSVPSPTICNENT